MSNNYSLPTAGASLTSSRNLFEDTFDALLTNFSGSALPETINGVAKSASNNGFLWFDSTNSLLKVWYDDAAYELVQRQDVFPANVYAVGDTNAPYTTIDDALVAATTAAHTAANPGLILVGSGEFRLQSTITTFPDYVDIKGYGKEHTVILQPDGDNAIINDSSISGRHYISDCTLKSSNTSGTTYMINLTTTAADSEKFIFDNVYFASAYHGIIDGNSNSETLHIEFNNCDFTVSTTGTNIPIMGTIAERYYFRDCHVLNGDSMLADQFIASDTSLHLNIQGLMFSNYNNKTLFDHATCKAGYNGSDRTYDVFFGAPVSAGHSTTFSSYKPAEHDDAGFTGDALLGGFKWAGIYDTDVGDVATITYTINAADYPSVKPADWTIFGAMYAWKESGEDFFRTAGTGTFTLVDWIKFDPNGNNLDIIVDFESTGMTAGAIHLVFFYRDDI